MVAIPGIEKELEVLEALDSPQLEGLAPELVDLRDEATAIALKMNPPDGKGCKSCARKRMLAALQRTARTMIARLEENPALLSVFPALLTTGRQSWQDQS